MPPTGETPTRRQQIIELLEKVQALLRLEPDYGPAVPTVAQDLYRWAVANLKNNERRLVEAVCLCGGRYLGKDLAHEFGWPPGYEQLLDKTLQRINRKLDKTELPWRFRRWDADPEVYRPDDDWRKSQVYGGD
jgi:hypothetical protein